MAFFETAKVLEFGEGEDPKQVVFDALGDFLQKCKVLYRNEVLVVTAPVRKSLIIRTDKTIEEERYQSKVGIVVQLGELAFKDDAIWPNEDTRPKVGDWVTYVTSNASRERKINALSCRLIRDDLIEQLVSAPDSIR